MRYGKKPYEFLYFTQKSLFFAIQLTLHLREPIPERCAARQGCRFGSRHTLWHEAGRHASGKLPARLGKLIAVIHPRWRQHPIYSGIFMDWRNMTQPYEKVGMVWHHSSIFYPLKIIKVDQNCSWSYSNLSIFDPQKSSITHIFCTGLYGLITGFRRVEYGLGNPGFRPKYGVLRVKYGVSTT